MQRMDEVVKHSEPVVLEALEGMFRKDGEKESAAALRNARLQRDHGKARVGPDILL